MKSSCEEAASGISQRSLSKAKDATRIRAERFLDILKAMEGRLQAVDRDHRFAKALALYELAYLPLRPEMCPFCLEYADDRCEECGYAKTHGGICDRESSRFVQLTDAINELAISIKFSDAEDLDIDVLESSIDSARTSTLALISKLEGLDASGFMQTKSWYIKNILSAIPVKGSLEQLRQECLKRAERYW